MASNIAGEDDRNDASSPVFLHFSRHNDVNLIENDYLCTRKLQPSVCYTSIRIFARIKQQKIHEADTTDTPASRRNTVCR